MENTELRLNKQLDNYINIKFIFMQHIQYLCSFFIVQNIQNVWPFCSTTALSFGSVRIKKISLQ